MSALPTKEEMDAVSAKLATSTALTDVASLIVERNTYLISIAKTLLEAIEAAVPGAVGAFGGPIAELVTATAISAINAAVKKRTA